MDIKKNDDIKLNIESVTSEGSAVGHYNGIAVFVRGAVPGDIIVAHIIKTSKKYAIGIIKDIITASPSRIKSDCPVSDKCGGCSFRNMTYDEELKYKRSRVVDAVERIGHIQTEITDVTAADTVYNYRNKAQYPVSICDGELFAGFYAYKSHRIISCDDCKLQSKNFKSCLDAFAKWVEHSGITSYDENSGRGILRHIYLREACATGEIMACAVINADSLPDSDYLVEQLKAVQGVKSMADKAKQIIGVEIVPQAIENAKINAKINNVENAEFLCGDAYFAADELKRRHIKPDVIVLDPPRKGCQKELLGVINSMSPEKIVYVSCDSATLARDLAILDEYGYKANQITPVDMFPRTPHVECVCLLTKKG